MNNGTSKYWGIPRLVLDRFPGMAVYKHTQYTGTFRQRDVLAVIPFDPKTYFPLLYYTNPLKLGSINFQNHKKFLLRRFRRPTPKNLRAENPTQITRPTSDRPDRPYVQKLRAENPAHPQKYPGGKPGPPPKIPGRKTWPRSSFSHTTGNSNTFYFTYFFFFYILSTLFYWLTISSLCAPQFPVLLDEFFLFAIDRSAFRGNLMPVTHTITSVH